MRRAERLFQLVNLLGRRKFATAAELGERLEVSVRTVYRDVSHLISSGIPIAGEAGIGYRLDPSYRLPPLMFSASEVEALVIGMRMVESWGDKGLRRSALSILDKVGSLLADTPNARGGLEQTALFSLSFGLRGTATHHLAELRAAVNGRYPIAFTYEDGDGRVSTRTAKPLGLYFWGRTWTLAAWCELRGDFRNFRIDRIEALEVGEATFELVPPCTLSNYTTAMLARDRRLPTQTS